MYQGYILIQWLGCPIKTRDSSLSYKTIWMSFYYSLYLTLSYLWGEMGRGLWKPLKKRQGGWMQDNILFTDWPQIFDSSVCENQYNSFSKMTLDALHSSNIRYLVLQLNSKVTLDTLHCNWNLLVYRIENKGQLWLGRYKKMCPIYLFWWWVIIQL